MKTAAQNFEIFKTLLLKQVDAVNQFHGSVYGVVEVAAENIHEAAEFRFFGDVAVLEYPSLCRGEYFAMLKNAEDVGVTVKSANAAGSAYSFYFGPIDPSEIDKAYAINQQSASGINAIERAEWDHERGYHLCSHNITY
jgi:hypothetical protein